MKIEKLGFGFMRLPLTDADDVRSIDRGQLEKMVDYFIEHSFTYFDTAYMYHDYTSEEALRGALVERHPRDSFTVATKLPLMLLEKEGDQERIFEEQLKNAASNISTTICCTTSTRTASTKWKNSTASASCESSKRRGASAASASHSTTRGDARPPARGAS